MKPSRGKRMAKALLEASDAKEEEYPQVPKWLEIFQRTFPGPFRQ